MRTLLFLWAIFHLTSTFGQINPDSLVKQLDTVRSTEERIKINIALADHYVYSMPDESLMYAAEALSLAQNEMSPSMIATSLNRLGTANWSKGDLEEAVTYLNRSLKMADSLNDRRLAARNLGYLGNVNSMAGNDIASVEYYTKALEEFLLLNNENRIWAMLNNIGKSYLDNNQLDSAAKYLNLADDAFKSEFERMRAIHLFNLGELAFKSGNDILADSLLNACLEKAINFNDARAMARAYQTMSEIAMRQGNSEVALNLAEKAYGIAGRTGVKELQQICAKTLSSAYALIGNFTDAYAYLQISDQFLDSLQSKMIKSQLALFRQEQNNLELEMVRQQGELAASKAEARQNIIFALVGVILLSGVLIYILVRQRKELEEQRVELSKLNNFKNRMFAIVTHDLRSPVGQLPNLIDIIIEQLASPKDLLRTMPILKEQVGHVLGMMDNLLNWAKSNIDGKQVRKQELDLHLLVDNLTQRIGHLYTKKNVGLVNQIQRGLLINSDSHLLTIVLRNLIVNAIKYSHDNSTVEIGVVIKNELTEISVKDKGVGMSEEKVNSLFTYDTVNTRGTKGEGGHALGLVLCKDFVEEMGGEIWVQSALNEGTTFTFSVNG